MSMFIKSQNNRSIINTDFCSGFYIIPRGQETPELGGDKECARLAATCDGEELVIARYNTDEQAEEVLDFIGFSIARNNGKITKLPTQDEIEQALRHKTAAGCDGDCDNCKEGKTGDAGLDEFLEKLFKGVL